MISYFFLDFHHKLVSLVFGKIEIHYPVQGWDGFPLAFNSGLIFKGLEGGLDNFKFFYVHFLLLFMKREQCKIMNKINTKT